jgi:hypothetical protein
LAADRWYLGDFGGGDERRRGEQEGRLRQPLTERYRERLAGVLSCYERIIVTGTLPGLG